MQDTGLHQRFWKDRINRLRKPFQAVSDRDENVVGAAVSNLGRDPQPELGRRQSVRS